MAVSIINLGDSETIVKAKIIDILENISIASTGIVNWGDARTRLNNGAVFAGFPTIANEELGLSARTKINALATFSLSLSFDKAINSQYIPLI